MKYIRIERNDVAGNYTVPKELLESALDAEFDGLEYLPNDTQVILTVVEMSEDEYAKLPEFEGW